MEHEYAILGGMNRSRVGWYIGMVAAGLSSFLVGLLLALVDLARVLGFGEYVPSVILPPVGAGVVFAALYWLFNSHVWKWGWCAQGIGVPNLAGRWKCDGQTINPDKTKGHVWEGTITITQSWDKLHVRLRTPQSGSTSVTAALVKDGDRFRLLYSYRNDPRVDQPELQPHRGYAELEFSPDLKAAEGEYFNGLGRFTFGTMNLTREA